VTHFRRVSVTNSLAVIVSLTLSSRLNKYDGKCIVVGCCNRDTDKQLGLNFQFS